MTLLIGILSFGMMPASPTQTASWFRGKNGWFTPRYAFRASLVSAIPITLLQTRFPAYNRNFMLTFVVRRK
jgi:hypothetical protein